MLLIKEKASGGVVTSDGIAVGKVIQLHFQNDIEPSERGVAPPLLLFLCCVFCASYRGHHCHINPLRVSVPIIIYPAHSRGVLAPPGVTLKVLLMMDLLSFTPDF